MCRTENRVRDRFVPSEASDMALHRQSGGPVAVNNECWAGW